LVWLSQAKLHGTFFLSQVTFQKGQLSDVILTQRRVTKTGVTVTQRLIDSAQSGTTISSGQATGGSTQTQASCLITDTDIITRITTESNWLNQNFIGSLAGLTECNYYFDYSTKIKYEFDGTHLVRYYINTIL